MEYARERENEEKKNQIHLKSLPMLKMARKLNANKQISALAIYKHRHAAHIPWCKWREKKTLIEKK